MSNDEPMPPDPRASVECLGLSARARHALRSHNIYTLGQLLACEAEELARWKNVGSTTLHDIRRALNHHGLQLSDAPTSDRAIKRKVAALAWELYRAAPTTDIRLCLRRAELFVIESNGYVNGDSWMMEPES